DHPGGPGARPAASAWPACHLLRRLGTQQEPARPGRDAPGMAHRRGIVRPGRACAGWTDPVRDRTWSARAEGHRAAHGDRRCAVHDQGALLHGPTRQDRPRELGPPLRGDHQQQRAGCAMASPVDRHPGPCKLQSGRIGRARRLHCAYLCQQGWAVPDCRAEPRHPAEIMPNPLPEKTRSRFPAKATGTSGTRRKNAGWHSGQSGPTRGRVSPAGRRYRWRWLALAAAVGVAVPLAWWATTRPTAPPAARLPSTMSIPFSASADAYVSAARPDVNRGRSPVLRTASRPRIMSYLTFPASGLTGTVTAATLRL